jgi:threonine aldolase
MDKVIDLRSDTVTHPTDEMRQAMFEALVGDDVYGEDPTVNALEKLGAELMGKEAAVFTTSGTMSNLISVLAQTRRGDEIIVGSQAHIFWYEVGGVSALGGAVIHTVPNNPDGTIDLDAVEGAVRGTNIHYPPSTLLCLENTHNRCGGAVLDVAYTSDAAALVHRHGLRLHIDGARIFNAAVALQVPARELVKDADSVGFCLSKGLSAPVGSVLCGDHDFVERARKYRKMVGGGMRQAGVLAAAGLVALRNIDGLAEDHAHARRLADGLRRIPGLIVAENVPTNIVLFDLALNIDNNAFLKDIYQRGVKVSPRGGRQFRLVTHRMISTSDIDEALGRIEGCMRQLLKAG